MPRLLLLRHAMTRGNLERRWTGITDEPLAPEGVALARRSAGTGEFLPRRVWSSPLLRCRETAALLWPEVEAVAVPALRETGFGPFENKNHQELAGDPLYEEWTRSGGTAPVPGLESREEVAARALPALGGILDTLAASGEDGAVVTHGGIIMECCAAWGSPPRDYSRWWVPCCGGWLVSLEDWRGTGRFALIREIHPVREEKTP